MAEPQKTPTLAEAFVWTLIEPLIKKPLFGKRRLPLAVFLTAGGFLFETGAALGWAYRDRQLVFEQVVGQPETPGQLVRFMRLKAKERVTEGISQDDSLGQFVYKTQVARLGHPMDMSSIEGMEGFANWVKNQSLDLDTAYSELQFLFYEGVGYGFEFPEETQRRWRAFYEKPKTREDLLSWRKAYQYGVVTTPEPSAIQTWDERVSELKNALKEYIGQFMPTLNTLFANSEALRRAKEEEQLNIEDEVQKATIEGMKQGQREFTNLTVKLYAWQYVRNYWILMAFSVSIWTVATFFIPERWLGGWFMAIVNIGFLLWSIACGAMMWKFLVLVMPRGWSWVLTISITSVTIVVIRSFGSFGLSLLASR